MKKYELILCVSDLSDSESTLHIESTNDGFSPLEILGLLQWKSEDILKQMSGTITPDFVKRTVIKDEEGPEESSPSITSSQWLASQMHPAAGFVPEDSDGIRDSLVSRSIACPTTNPE